MNVSMNYYESNLSFLIGSSKMPNAFISNTLNATLNLEWSEVL